MVAGLMVLCQVFEALMKDKDGKKY